MTDYLCDNYDRCCRLPKSVYTVIGNVTFISAWKAVQLNMKMSQQCLLCPSRFVTEAEGLRLSAIQIPSWQVAPLHSISCFSTKLILTFALNLDLTLSGLK